MRGRVKIDWLIVGILTAVAIAIVAPARGGVAEFFSTAANVAIAALFFLHGARLSTREALAGLTNWRLHSVILAFTYVVFPIIGVALRFAVGTFIPSDLAMGFLYMALVPSTVQSSVAFTAVARGNVPGAIVAASTSNLVGVVATPLLVMLTMQVGTGVRIDTSVFIDISLQLLLPFIIGQLLRPWVGRFASAKATSFVDKFSISLVVYVAFSQGMVERVWASTSIAALLILCVLAAVILVFMLWLTRLTATRLHFNRADQIAIQFCGTKKSIATGLPMAAVIFGGSTAMLILPLMLYHQIQLIVCAWLAARYAKQNAG